MKTDKKQETSDVHQVRGSDLRKKMIESEKYGEEFRVANQGHDVLDQKIKHNVPKPAKPKK